MVKVPRKRVSVRLHDGDINWLYSAMKSYIEEPGDDRDDEDGDPDILMRKLLRARVRVRTSTQRGS